MTYVRDSLKGVARGIKARLTYLNLEKRIYSLILNNQTNEAYRLQRHRNRLYQILYVK